MGVDGSQLRVVEPDLLVGQPDRIRSRSPIVPHVHLHTQRTSAFGHLSDELGVEDSAVPTSPSDTHSASAPLERASGQPGDSGPYPPASDSLTRPVVQAVSTSSVQRAKPAVPPEAIRQNCSLEPLTVDDLEASGSTHYVETPHGQGGLSMMSIDAGWQPSCESVAAAPQPIARPGLQQASLPPSQGSGQCQSGHGGYPSYTQGRPGFGADGRTGGAGAQAPITPKAVNQINDPHVSAIGPSSFQPSAGFLTPPGPALNCNGDGFPTLAATTSPGPKSLVGRPEGLAEDLGTTLYENFLLWLKSH